MKFVPEESFFRDIFCENYFNFKQHLIKCQNHDRVKLENTCVFNR